MSTANTSRSALVAMPGAPSRVLAPSNDALVVSCYLVSSKDAPSSTAMTTYSSGQKLL